MTKRKNIKKLIFVLVALTSIKLLVGAQSSYAQVAPEVDHEIEVLVIDRHAKLTKFFEFYNSPLVDEVDTFIEVADEYGIDYRLLPAISGVESTFCKNIIDETHNCYGWGIYGNNVIYFESFEDGVRTVAKGLNEGYFAQGADTVDEIAPIYNPPTPNEWGWKVKFFMNKVDEIYENQ